MTSATPPNLFGAKTPSVSFKDAAPGTRVRIVVDRYPEQVHSTDYLTGKPAYWPDGNPKYSIVINGKVDGEDRALWVPKSSSMYAAIAEAQQTAAMLVGPGVVLDVTFLREEPNDDPRLNPVKKYAAEIMAPPPQNSFVTEPREGYAQANPPAAPAYVPAPPPPTPAPAYVPPPAAPAAPAPSAPTLTPEQYAALAAAGVDVSAFAVSA